MGFFFSFFLSFDEERGREGGVFLFFFVGVGGGRGGGGGGGGGGGKDVDVVGSIALRDLPKSETRLFLLLVCRGYVDYWRF